jgi:hypothetical protein
MPSKFLGINGCGPQKSNAVMAWQIQPGNGDIVSPAILPPLPSNWLGGIAFQLLPQQNQGNFQFSNVRKVRVTVNRPVSWIETSDNPDLNNVFWAGRVIIYFPGSQEVICFSPEIFSNIPVPVSGLYESDRISFDTWIPATSQIIVYMEQDNFIDGGVGGQTAPINTSVWLTLFNFNPDIV